MKSEPLKRARTVVERHALVTLAFLATILVPSWMVAHRGPDQQASRVQSDKCMILEAYFRSPEARKDHDRSSMDVERWVDMYERDCR